MFCIGCDENIDQLKIAAENSRFANVENKLQLFQGDCRGSLYMNSICFSECVISCVIGVANLDLYPFKTVYVWYGNNGMLHVVLSIPRYFRNLKQYRYPIFTVKCTNVAININSLEYRG